LKEVKFVSKEGIWWKEIQRDIGDRSHFCAVSL